jgi:hypothetical protein
MKLLKTLANRAGTSFAYDPKNPLSMRQASEEIQRMQDLRTNAGNGKTFAEGHSSPEERQGTARFSVVEGYGSTASFTAPERDPASAPQLSDGQELEIIKLQGGTGDETVQRTVVEANEYLDEARECPVKPPSERQLAYMHSLESKLGYDNQQLTHPASSIGASRRIERYLNQLEQRSGGSADTDLAATLALAGAASPHSIEEVADAAQARSSTASTVPNLTGSAALRLSGEHATLTR